MQWVSIKNREPEAEHDLQIITLLSSYCLHIDQLYIKLKVIFLSMY